MEELKKLEIKINEKLDQIRNKEEKTLNETEYYKKLQSRLREVRNVMIYLKEMK